MQYLALLCMAMWCSAFTLCVIQCSQICVKRERKLNYTGQKCRVGRGRELQCMAGDGMQDIGKKFP